MKTKLAIPTLLCLALLPAPAFAERKSPKIVQVEVVAPSEDRAVKYVSPGLFGAFQGVKTANVVFTVNVIIDGDHARLTCYEQHRGCTAIGPGKYDGEVAKDSRSLWISFPQPVSHAIIRNHWKIAGTW